MLRFCGFNGFGQLETKDLVIPHFTEFKVGLPEPDELSLVAASWNYIACAAGNQLTIRGFLSDTNTSTLGMGTGKPQNCLLTTAPADITYLSACDKFCLILTLDGRLYKLLPKVDAQLEEIKLDLDEEPVLSRKRNVLGDYTNVPDFKVTHIACGSNIAVAFTNTNGVYSIPSKVHQFPPQFRIKQLVCGFEHALVLNSNGDVYAWGNGLRGQLGTDVLRIEESPILLEALAGLKITFIAAGGWHSAAISAFGDIYTWGFNSNGQLGLRLFKTNDEKIAFKNPSVYPLPQLIELPLECCVEGADVTGQLVSLCSAAKVYAGARHMLVLMTCGTLYAVGWNAHGQLGLNTKDREQIDVLEKVESGVIDVNCGAWCTILKKL